MGSDENNKSPLALFADLTRDFDPAKLASAMTGRAHSGFIGMEYSAHGENWAELGLPWREDLVGMPDTGVLASGPIVSLLDNATSIAVWIRRGRFLPQVTLDLRIDYLRAATPGKKVYARGECYQVKKSMAFVRGIAHEGDLDDPIANAAGIFILIGEG